MDSETGRSVGAVVYEAPQGTEGYLIKGDDRVVRFGRSGNCQIRFGYSPVPDLRLARIAGAFLVAGTSRVAVECSSEPGHVPLTVREPGRPPVEVRLGEAFSPASEEFDVAVHGDRDWSMSVRCRRESRCYDSRPDEPSTTRRSVDLSDQERRVLEMYVRPLRLGAVEPAGHKEVAAALNFSVSKVRFDLYRIWSKMVTAGIAIPNYSDKRVAVATAALSHHLA